IQRVAIPGDGTAFFEIKSPAHGSKIEGVATLLYRKCSGESDFVAGIDCRIQFSNTLYIERILRAFVDDDFELRFGIRSQVEGQVETRQCSRGGHRVEFGKHIGASRIAFVYKFDYSISMGDTRVFVRYNKHEVGVSISFDVAVDGGLHHLATDADTGSNLELADESVVRL